MGQAPSVECSPKLGVDPDRRFGRGPVWKEEMWVRRRLCSSECKSWEEDDKSWEDSRLGIVLSHPFAEAAKGWGTRLSGPAMVPAIWVAGWRPSRRPGSG